MKRVLIAASLFAAVCAGLFAARAGLRAVILEPDAAEGQSYTITIKDFDFTPRDLTIPAGSKVTWINKDEEPHKVAEADDKFKSGALDTDEHFTHVFKSAGKFEFFCTLHPRMTGHIVVEQK